MISYFKYGEKETNYLKNRDQRLGEVIDKIGPIQREIDPDLFSSVIHHIIGQQISNKALATIWNRRKDDLGKVNPDSIIQSTNEKLQSFGISFRKTEYIKEFALKVHTGQVDLDVIQKRNDQEAIDALCQLKGIGVWTAERILLFSRQRPNIFSKDDLAIQRGLRRVYHHRNIDAKLFEKYRKRFSPYCSVASLYFWAVAAGAIKGMKDYQKKPMKTNGDRDDKHKVL